MFGPDHYFSPFSDLMIQSQLTSFNAKHDVKTRQAAGFDFFGGHKYGSYYREVKLDFNDWLAKLNEKRTEANVHPDDFCRFDNNGHQRSDQSCFKSYMLDTLPIEENPTCEDLHMGHSEFC